VRSQMDIKLHPEALRHFSEQAEGIRASLGPVPLWPPQRPLTGSHAHLPIKNEIQLGVDTGDAPWVEGRMDPLLGRYVTLEIHSPRFRRALSAKGMQAFNRLADQVSRHREVSPWCGLKYVENCLIRWLQDAQAGEVSPWGDALVAALERDVQRRRVLVPIQGIAIEKELALGSVRFGYFTARYFEEKVADRMRQRGRTEEEVAIMRRQLERYEGLVYASVECTAEPGHAKELALGAVEHALALLRFLHPAALDARAHCSLGRMGGLSQDQAHFIVELDDSVETINQEIRRPPFDLDFSDPEVEQAIGGNLATLHDVLSSTTRTDLQSRVLAAMVLFSNGLLFDGIEHRLLHALVAVESLLLKNANEPIMGNVALRVAHLVGQNLEERRGIVQDLRAAYEVRSGFVHHGQLASVETIDLVNRVIQHCWTAVLVLLGDRPWATKEQLIKGLEDQVLS
jgi:hypothetical protein